MTTRHQTWAVALIGTTGLILSLGLRADAANAPVDQPLAGQPVGIDTPTSKGPEVSTVGTDVYQGPIPAEMAKLALVESSPQTAPAQEKVPAASTSVPGSGQAMSPDALAKLAEYLATPVTLPLPEQSKLELMQVPTEGEQALTPEELAKRARELAARRATSPNAPEAPRSGR